MIPPNKKMEYEKIQTSDFVTGEIKDIKYDLEHVFKGFGKDKEGNPNKDKTGIAVRIVFKVDGYKFDHGTPWMSLSLSEKSNLYKKYVSSLVSNCEPFMDFDIDQLKGMKVKMLWKDVGDFQHIDIVRPIGEKLIPKLGKIETPEDEETVPF